MGLSNDLNSRLGLALTSPGAATELAAAVDANTAKTGASALATTGVAAGYKIARGESALDGSNPTPVTTGLTTCIAFVAMLKGAVAPGVGTSVITSVISSGDANVYGWKPTSNSDPTLVASTGTDGFYWIAIGT